VVSKLALQLARIEVVVLDGVARAQDVRLLQALHRSAPGSIWMSKGRLVEMPLG
jgi:hypothetical protein